MGEGFLSPCLIHPSFSFFPLSLPPIHLSFSETPFSPPYPPVFLFICLFLSFIPGTQNKFSFIFSHYILILTNVLHPEGSSPAPDSSLLVFSAPVQGLINIRQSNIQ